MHTLSATLNNSQRQNAYRGQVLIDASKQFAESKTLDLAQIDQFKSLFYGLVHQMDAGQLKFISTLLARSTHLPAQIAYFLALEHSEVAAPILLMSPVMKQEDFLKIEHKLSNEKLAIVARRPDMGVQLAQRLVARKSTAICMALELNPVFRLNSISESNKAQKAPETVTIDKSARVNQAREELLALAMGARGVEISPQQNSRLAAARTPTVPFHEKLLAVLRDGDKLLANQMLADKSGLGADTVSSLATAERPDGIVILLKGLGFKKAQASQMLLGISPLANRSVNYFNAAMQLFTNVPSEECKKMLAALGAKLPDHATKDSQRINPASKLMEKASDRRRQISRKPSSQLFGGQRLAS